MFLGQLLSGWSGWLKSCRSARRCERKSTARRARPELEGLEDRRVPAVTDHGGGVLPHVEVQALYYGSDWYNNATYYNQTGYLEGYLNSVVHGSYLDMLNKAGYNVGQGSFDAGRIGLVNINKASPLTDAQIQSGLQSYISNGTLKSPDSNRLYVVFVEDNVVVKSSDGSTSAPGGFAGYHGAFAGHDAAGRAVDLHYAVIPYAGGPNGTFPWLSPVGQLTEASSHEIAEAVTDPNVNYKGLGWYDDANRGEIGDLVNAQTVYLNGYAVQRESDKNDQALTPAGATAVTPASFVLQTNGQLWEHVGGSWVFVSGGVASVSDQGIDNTAHAMVDYVTTAGAAYEFHDGAGSTFLTNGAFSARAGQGVSYVLLTNGNLYEYKDSTQGWSYLSAGVARIEAGTDKTGVNAVDVVLTSGAAWEVSDTSGWHFIASGVQSISAGQQGIADYVTTAGNAYLWTEATGSSGFLASGVAGVWTGVGSNGSYQIELLYTNGTAWEYKTGSGWTSLGSGLLSLSKARAGLISLVSTSGNAYDHSDAGVSTFLTSGAKAVA
jgi:hypothetical protein